MIVQNSTEYDLDTQLMLRFTKGDNRAFETLVDRCQDRLIQFLSMMTRDAAMGEDLAQEVLIRLYRARDTYRPRAPFKTFMYTIARNLWVDHQRRQSNRIREVNYQPDNHPNLQKTDHPCQAAEDLFPIGMDGSTLGKAFLELTRDHREVLLLSLIEELSHREIATLLKIPAGTVKSRMYYALKNLRRLLETEDD